MELRVGTFAYISGTMDQELLLRNEYLAAENQLSRRFSRSSRTQRAKLGGFVSTGPQGTRRCDRPCQIPFWDGTEGSSRRSMPAPRQAIEELIVLMAEPLLGL